MTIKEIAVLTGVSPTTVANVIHGRTGKMSKEILERVSRALEEHKYTINMGARVIGNCGSRLIGVIVNYARRETINVAQEPFYGEIIGRLKGKSGKTVTICFYIRQEEWMKQFGLHLPGMWKG
jgi:LacI family transcriptional regulator